MTRRACSKQISAAVLAAAAWLAAAPAWAVETADAAILGRTRVIFQLAGDSPIDVKSRFQASPPAVVLEFPQGQVFATLPERSAIRSGAVLGLIARYGEESTRSLRAIEVALRGDYSHRVQIEDGRIILEIQHPQALPSASIEVGMLGSSVIRNLSSTRVTQRFQAMQEALTDAQAPTLLPSSSVAAQTAPAPAAAALRPHHPVRASSAPAPARTWGIILVLLAAAAGVAQLWPRRATGAARLDPQLRLPSGMTLIDQLVLRAFERQGFRVLASLDPGALPGTARLITKDGAQAALAAIGNGMFFEKQTVERFAKLMRSSGVTQGYLVATGAFTVPAQRLAKERGIALIGREHVVELLSAGATSEFFTKQLEDARHRLGEARETLRHYASQLDALRRQRNEATWHLGEERAKAGKLEVDLAALTAAVQQQEAAIERARTEAESLQRRWDENEWYLGEARARVRFLEAQRDTQAEAEVDRQVTERARDEANWYLGEERRKVLELSGKMVELQNALDASVARELSLQEAFDEIRRKLSALETYGNRRRGIRSRIPEAVLELRNGKDDVLFSGEPRDFSLEGIGLETGHQMPTGTLQARLSLPGMDPVDSEARVVWQRAGGEPPRVSVGCRWLTLPEPAKARLESLLSGQPGAS